MSPAPLNGITSARTCPPRSTMPSTMGLSLIFWAWVRLSNARGLPPTYVSSASTTPSSGSAVSLVHELGANQVEHAPRALVRHTDLSLQLLGRDAASRTRHHVNRVVPKVQRRGRLLEDRPDQRVNVMPATLRGA